jgi:hypothetical protein
VSTTRISTDATDRGTMHPWHPYPHPCLAPPLPRAAEQGEVRGLGCEHDTDNNGCHGSRHDTSVASVPASVSGSPATARPPRDTSVASVPASVSGSLATAPPPARHFRGSRAFRVELPAVSNNVAVAR